jgi:hypothetical protein
MCLCYATQSNQAFARASLFRVAFDAGSIDLGVFDYFRGELLYRSKHLHRFLPSNTETMSTWISSAQSCMVYHRGTLEQLS